MWPSRAPPPTPPAPKRRPPPALSPCYCRQACLSKHLHGGAWEAVLQPVAAAHGLPPPSPLELIPMVGTEAVVFLLGPMALKIFVHEVGRAVGLGWAAQCVWWEQGGREGGAAEVWVGEGRARRRQQVAGCSWSNMQAVQRQGGVSTPGAAPAV